MSERPPARIGSATVLVAAGATLLFAAYWLIFALTTDDGIVRGAGQAASNAIPALLLAIAMHAFLVRSIWSRRPVVRLTAQVPLALGFAIAWYLSVIVLQAWRTGSLAEGFTLRPFVPIAFAWQMFQGVTFYALTAVSSFAIVVSRELEELRQTHLAPRTPPAPTDELLVKTGDSAERVAIDSIASISGAGDYVEIALPGRTILSATTLAEFEGRLPQDRFIRAHRSHLVRVGAIERSEPAGNGRTALHLVDGRTLVTSRAGSRALREAAL